MTNDELKTAIELKTALGEAEMDLKHVTAILDESKKSVHDYNLTFKNGGLMCSLELFPHELRFALNDIFNKRTAAKKAAEIEFKEFHTKLG